MYLRNSSTFKGIYYNCIFSRKLHFYMVMGSYSQLSLRLDCKRGKQPAGSVWMFASLKLINTFYLLSVQSRICGFTAWRLTISWSRPLTSWSLLLHTTNTQKVFCEHRRCWYRRYQGPHWPFPHSPSSCKANRNAGFTVQTWDVVSRLTFSKKTNKYTRG